LEITAAVYFPVIMHSKLNFRTEDRLYSVRKFSFGKCIQHL